MLFSEESGRSAGLPGTRPFATEPLLIRLLV